MAGGFLTIGVSQFFNEQPMAKRLKQSPNLECEDLDTLSEEEIAAMPTFSLVEDLNWWGLSARWEKMVKRRGELPLFERSTKLPGFAEAMLSAKAGLAIFHERNAGTLPARGEMDFRELFFSALQRDSVEALRGYEPIITEAAKNGDLEFFLRIQREIRKSQRRRNSGSLDYFVVGQWLHGFLWLMSDQTAHSYLRHRCDFKFSFDAYQQTRKRLKLVGYRTFSAHPIIVGHTKTEFKYRQGWTNLEPKLTT